MYVVISKLFEFFGWQNIGGGGAICPTPLPPVPTAMSNHANVEIVNTTELRIGASKWFQSVHRLRSRIYW